jgi:hypothetical protein
VMPCWVLIWDTQKYFSRASLTKGFLFLPIANCYFCSHRQNIIVLRGARVPKSNPRFRLVILFVRNPSHAKSRSKFCKVENVKASKNPRSLVWHIVVQLTLDLPPETLSHVALRKTLIILSIFMRSKALVVTFDI